MFQIEITRFWWVLDDGKDDPADQCLHGHVRVLIGNETLEDDCTVSSTGLLMGTVKYGASGYYFPASSDILDISLLKTDSVTGLVTEVSHQRLRNFQKFPIQFTVRYDNADIGENDTCTLIVTLLIDGQVKGQGLTLLTRSRDGFSDADLTLLSV